MKNDWDLTPEKIEKHLLVYYDTELESISFTHYIYEFYYLFEFTLNGVNGGMFIKEDDYFKDKPATLDRISKYVLNKADEGNEVKLG